MALWLTPWLLVDLFLTQALLFGGTIHWTSGDVMTPLDLLFGALTCTIVGSIGGGAFLWMIAGKEVVSVDSQGVRIQLELFGFRFRSRQISLESIEGIRPAKLWRVTKGGGRRSLRAVQMVTTNETITFGEDIGPEQSSLIIKKLLEFGEKQGVTLKALTARDDSYPISYSSST